MAKLPTPTETSPQAMPEPAMAQPIASTPAAESRISDAFGAATELSTPPSAPTPPTEPINPPPLPGLTPWSEGAKLIVNSPRPGSSEQKLTPAQHLENVFAQPSGDLAPNTPKDDRVDASIAVRENDYKLAGDLNWLMTGMAQPGSPGKLDLTPAAEKFQGKPASETTAGKIAADIGMGAVEAPGQAVEGARDAVQNTIDLGKTLDELHSLGGFVFTPSSEKVNPNSPKPGEPGFATYEAARQARLGGKITYAPPEEWQKLVKSGAVKEPDLPHVPGAHQPTTVTGSVVRGLAQFMTGFYMAGKAIGGTTGATALGTTVRTGAASAVTDFAAYAPDQSRLSNLIQGTPLANPVTEYLAAKPSDTGAEGRFKNVLEGIFTANAAVVLGRAFKSYKMAWSAAKGAKTPTEKAQHVAGIFRQADQEMVAQQAADMGLIGSAEGMPLTARIGAKIKAATAETELGVPTDIGAKALNFPVTGKLTPIDQTGETFVNFARINAPEDVQRVIDDTASAFKESIDKTRRGVRTNIQTTLSAADENAWNVLMSRRVGQPLNAEQSVAARQLWVTSGDKLGQVAREAANNPNPQNLFQFRRMMVVHQAIQKEVIGARTETARALQSWAIPVGSNSAKLSEMDKAITESGGIEQSLDLARKIAVLSNMPDMRGAMDGFIDKTWSQKALGSVQEYWINALLSNPKTHARNILSNTITMAIDPLEKATAARVGWLLSSEPEAVKIGEAAQEIYGMVGAINDAFANASQAIRYGQSGYGIGKVELPRHQFITGGGWGAKEGSFIGKGIDALGAVVNTPGRLLMAEDEWFKTMNYRGELRALALRQAKNEGAPDIASRVDEILKDVPDAMHREAQAAAEYRTFQTPGGPMVRLINRTRANYPMLRYLIPFVNTPVNIMKYTAERTPLAVVTQRYKEAISAGGAQEAIAKTRMALGSAAILYAMDLAFNGHITGSGPNDNPKEMQNWKRQGYQPYSARIDNSWVNYNRIDPLGFHLGMGADLAEYVMNSQSGDFTAEWDEMFGAAVFGTIDNVMSKSYMSGLSSFSDAISDPKGYAKGYLANFAKSFVPAGVGELARQMDPVQRESHNVVTGFKKQLPGYSSTLPPRVDFYGRPLSYQSGLGTAFDRFSPLYGSEYKPEPIDKFMSRDGWYVEETSTLAFGGETISLRNMPEVKYRYYQLRGITKPSQMGPTVKAERLIDRYGDRPLLDVLNAIVTGKDDQSQEFMALDGPDERHDFVQKIITRYNAAAKETVLMEFPQISDLAKKKADYRLQQGQAPGPLVPQ